MGPGLVREGERESLIPVTDRWSWETTLARSKAARDNWDKLSEKQERIKESCMWRTKVRGKTG